MGTDAIAATLRLGLEDVPGAVGVNNHMGSRSTVVPEITRTVPEEIRERRLRVPDGRAARDAVGPDPALRVRIRALERPVFLDDRREGSYIESQIRGLVRKAREEGAAVGIGQPDPAAVRALRRSLGLPRSGAIQVVPASELAGGRKGRGSG